MAQKAIGPTFGNELAAAGLVGVAISWTSEGDILRGVATSRTDEGELVSVPLVSDADWAAVQAVYASHDPTTTGLRADKQAAIDFAFHARLEAGLAFMGKMIQIDDVSRSNIAAIALRAALKSIAVAGITWPDDGYAWRTLENDWLNLTVSQFLDMAQQAADLYTAIRVHYGDLKDAIAAATTAEAIAAVDPATGWPA